MNYFKSLAAYILLAIVLIAGSAYVVYGTRAFADQMTAPTDAQPQATAAPAPVATGRVETFGKNSPVIATAENVTITYDRGHMPPANGPKVLDDAPFTAVTHGDNSPVVIGKGNSITIRYN